MSDGKEWQPARLSAEAARWLHHPTPGGTGQGPVHPTGSDDPVGGGWDLNGAWRSRADPRPRPTPGWEGGSFREAETTDGFWMQEILAAEYVNRRMDPDTRGR